MKLFIDLFPVILFFAAFKLKGIFVATTVAIIASIIQISWMYYKHRKVEPMMWLSFAVILVFGGATLLFHNETFIKWKPTILYWLLSLAITGGQLFFGKNGMKAVMGNQLTLPEKTWTQLNLSWGGFFLVLGCVNLYVAYNFSTDTWVNFKLFGIMGLILLFSMAQGVVLNSLKSGEKSGEN
jgi:intracellular septation protein